MKGKIVAIGMVLSMAAAQAHGESGFEGFYAGASLDYLRADMDWETTATYDPSGVVYPGDSDPSESLSDGIAALGIHAGYNWSLSQTLLVGVELAASLGSMEDAVDDRIPGLGDPTSTPNSSSEVEAENAILLGVRGGYLLQPDLLVFGSLSLAQIDVSETSVCPADTNVCNPGDGIQRFSDDDTLLGWALGLGAEKEIRDSVSVRAEARYADYGDFDFTAIPAQSGSSYGADATLEVKSTTLLIGASYRF